MAITLEQAQARLQAYLDAEEAVLTGQSYRMDMGGSSRQLTRADLSSIQKGIELWQARVNQRSRTGGLRVAEVIPR